MAPVNTMSVLAFATAAFAIPFHGHGHAKYHNNKPSAAYPYPSANGTGIYPTGTGLATGASIAPVSETTVVSDVEVTTEVATTYADASTTCTSDVTVTSTVKKTVTVTASASSDVAPIESSSSSEASPVLSSSESSAPAYSAAPTTYSSKAEAVTQASESAPAAYSSPAPSSSASAVESSSAAPSMTYSAANKNVEVNVGYGPSSKSSSAAPSSSSASSYGGSSGKSGKRGIAYNDVKLTDCLSSSSKVSWAYNWGSSAGTGLSDSVSFVPTLWGPKSEFTDSWSDNAKKAIDSGSSHLFSFNEPDHSAQANLSPEQAASDYQKYMEPFAGKAKLCAPSVTNGGGSMGLNWLKSFLESCQDCTIDCLNVHWYDSASNVEYFKKHINDAADLAPGKEIFVSEFAATGSNSDISDFLETVMPWMDSNDSVGGYAYFMASEGSLVSGSEQSAIGKTYAS